MCDTRFRYTFVKTNARSSSGLSRCLFAEYQILSPNPKSIKTHIREVKTVDSIPRSLISFLPSLSQINRGHHHSPSHQALICLFRSLAYQARYV